MSGFAQAGPRSREPSTSQQCTHHHSLGRPRPLLLIAIAVFIRGVPRSRGWVLQVLQREAGSPLKRLHSSPREGPPFRRRTLITGHGVVSRGLSLSAAAANLSPPRANLGAARSASEKAGKVEERGQQGFEGSEKTLKVVVDPDIGHENGLRAIRREQWDVILAQAQCQILHHRGNEYFDSYVLSESSLFVYKSKLVLKTCGTTTLLRCLPLLKVVTKSYGLSLERMGYSRKNFKFPTDQIYPHKSFADEVDFLDTMFTGSAYVNGPLSGDHWYTYVTDDCKRPNIATADRTLNVMMYELEPEVAQNFFRSKGVQTAEDVSSRSGIRRVFPKATLQDHLFDPCGYSMNALEGRAYYTIHVTPESDFSYASFETNVRLPDYDDIVRGMLGAFRPKKFTMTLFAEKSGMENILQNPFDNTDINCAPTGASSETARYHRTIKTTTNFSGDYVSQMGNWVRAPPGAMQSAALEAA